MGIFSKRLFIDSYFNFIFYIKYMDLNKNKYKKYKTKYLKLKKHINGCTKINNVLDLVSKNARFLQKNYPFDVHKYINKLALNLKCDQWIKISSDKFNLNKETIKQKKQIYKPMGSWFSKGDWLFHDQSSIYNVYISLINVNYQNICILTNFDEINEFIEKYGNIETTNYGYNFIEIDWPSVSKDYQGICIIPNMSKEIIDSWPLTREEKFVKYNWLLGYDTSSLVLWNFESLLKHKIILYTGDYLLKNDKNPTKIIQGVDKIINKILEESSNFNK